MTARDRFPFPSPFHAAVPVWAGVLLILFGWLGPPVQGRSLSPPPFINERSYGAVLADRMEQVAASGKSRREVHRECRRILSDGLSKGGQRFRSEFPRGFRLDLSDPKYRKVAVNLLRGNKRNWHGYLRELKYLNEIARKSSPFQILSVGDRAPLRSGQLVEFDALLRDKRTGLRASAEFKDWRIDSRAKLDGAKRQIDKIARRAREQRVARSMWVNRARVPENFRIELERYGRRRNVAVYSGISTSTRLPHDLWNPRRFDDVLARESRSLRPSSLSRYAVRGGGFVAIAVGATQVGHAAYQWNRGALTTRRATISATQGGTAAVGTAGGAIGGAKAGALIGTAVLPGPGTAIGGVVGGILGGLAGGIGGAMVGGIAGNALVDHVVFRNLKEEETAALIDFLIGHYQS